MRRLFGERGASAVEFAIVASLLFMVVFGTVQFGIAYNRYQGLTAAAREGGRLASINATDDEIVARTKEATSIINTSGTAYPCGAGAPSTNEASCVNISVLQSGTTYVAYSASDSLNPCDRAQATNSSNPTVKVEMRYKMPINLVFVGTFAPVITGESHFRCEL